MSISSLDLNLVLVLHTVLAERNVARAAERLHVTPSAVSNALARLRDLLHDPLVTRKGRGVVPTPRAMELAPALARAIGEIEGALSCGPFDAATCTRSFTLAVADIGQIAWVPALVSAMREEMPLAHLRVVGIDALIAMGDLASPEIDLHLGLAAKGPGIHAEPLRQEQIVLAARRRHRATRGKLTRAALGELSHVRVDMVPGRNFRDAFAKLFERAGVPRKIAVTVPSFAAAAEIVATSELVTMLPASFLAAKGSTLNLQRLSAPLPAHTMTISMCWHERTKNDPAARAFRALTRRTLSTSERL